MDNGITDIINNFSEISKSTGYSLGNHHRSIEGLIFQKCSNTAGSTDYRIRIDFSRGNDNFLPIKASVVVTSVESSAAELNIGGQQVLEASEQINTITTLTRDGSGKIKDGTSSMLTNSENIKNILTRPLRLTFEPGCYTGDDRSL